MSSLPSNYPTGSLEPIAASKVEWFAQRYTEKFYEEYGFGHFLLAAYAAVPAYLTPDLLYKIWQNFNGYKWSGLNTSIHRIAVSDVLLSPLCREVGFELFEMEENIKLAFLEWLKNIEQSSTLWSKRGIYTVEQVAAFVQQYHKLPNSGFNRWGVSYTEAQDLEALSYSDPARVANILFDRMREYSGNQLESALLGTMDQFIKTKNRLTRLLPSDSVQLQNFSNNTTFVEALRDLIQKDNESFIKHLVAKPALLDLLQEENNGGIEVKVDGGIADKVAGLSQRKLNCLIIGVGNNSHDVNSARLIADLMAKRIPKAQLDIRPITGPAATKAAIIKACDALVKKTTASDDVLVYLAADALTHNDQCKVICADTSQSSSDTISFLLDIEVGARLNSINCSSITLILQTDHAATPYWLDVSKPQNVLIASSKHGQQPLFLNTKVDGKLYCSFTYAFVTEMEACRLKSTNRDLFVKVLSQYQAITDEKEKAHTWELKTPQLLCNAAALNNIFLQGKNDTAELQGLLQDSGYLTAPVNGVWNNYTAVALQSYMEAVDLPKHDGKQVYIDHLKAHKANQLNNSKPVFLLVFSDHGKTLPAMVKEKQQIAAQLRKAGANIQVELLENSTKEALSIKIKDPALRSRIELIYYSGYDSRGDMFLVDGPYTLFDLAPLLTYQKKLKLFVSNTCRSEYVAAYTTQLGIPAAIGIKDKVNDKDAADFGQLLFECLVDGKNIEMVMEYAGQIKKTQYSWDQYCFYGDKKLSWSFSLPPNPVINWQFQNRWICVIGSGADYSKEDLLTAKMVGKLLADEGYGLINGGWPGVDLATSESYFDHIRLYASEKASNYLLQFVENGNQPAFEQGVIEYVATNEWSKVVQRKSFAFISIGGKGFTYEMFSQVRGLGKTFVPLPHTGGDSEKIYMEMMSKGADSLSREYFELKSIDTINEKCIELIKTILKQSRTEEFKKTVEKLYKERSVTVADDLQKNRWGGKAKNNGKELTASIIKSGAGNFEITLTVVADHIPAYTLVALFLHHTFENEIEYVTVKNGQAQLVVNAYEAFTVGACTSDDTELELDLNKIPDAPRDFYYKEVSEVFKKQVRELYNSAAVVVSDDLQKRRWGGKNIVNGILLSASVSKRLLGFYKVELTISSVTQQPFMGDVAFFLHNTFKNEITFRKSIDGTARVSVTAYEAFTVGAYTEDGTRLELDLQKEQGYPKGFYYKETASDFYDEQEIKEQVAGSDKIGKKETVQNALLIFSTETQHTWLVFTNLKTYILLDDENTRKKKRIIQSSFNVVKTLPLKIRAANKDIENEAVVQFAAEKTWWYFSTVLFANKALFEEAIRKSLSEDAGKQFKDNARR